MRNKTIHRCRRWAGIFFLSLFLTYWGGVTLFAHSHAEHGVIVVHSHPFAAGHTHSHAQYETCFFLSFFATTGEPSQEVDLSVWLSVLAVILPASASFFSEDGEDAVCPRAPPACL